MTISDIITMISLIIAIVAIISEKNRKHLLLKFGVLDFVLYSIAFILINYFVFYNQFYEQGYFLDYLYFEYFGLRNPTNYSYIISLIILVSILFKIWYSFYPNRKREKVLHYYKTLIENQEISMLLDILERYHTKDIRKYISRTKNYDPKSEEWLFERFNKKTFNEKLLNFWNRFWRHTNPYSRFNRNSYASFVLHNIINDPAFVSLASNIRPYFFADIFITFKPEKRNSFPTELINQYLTELLKSKNFWLIKELKQSDNFDIGQPDWFFEENRIIAALIQDVSVADVNEIWKPFGEEAIKEIENERNLGTDSRLYQQYRNDDLLWEFKVFVSIKFFNILLIESIVKKYSGTHFFLSYYWHITESILQNFTAAPPKDFEEVESANHHLVKIMNDNLFHWLELSNKYETDRFYDIIRCIGNQIDCLTKNPFFGEARKLDLIEKILSLYCNIDEKGKTNLVRDELDKILLKPSMLTKSTDNYFEYISKVWKRFDKIPHHGYTNNIDYDYFSRLKQNVIIPLGLNPDEY